MTQQTVPDALRLLIEGATSRRSGLEPGASQDAVVDPLAPRAVHYCNQHQRLGIDFQVEKLPLPGLQSMDPRVVRVAPGRCSENHKHAHEALFFVLSGIGELHIEDQILRLNPGSLAVVPRWAMHQSRNIGTETLVLLTITDFGFTSSVLGDYDRAQRNPNPSPSA